MATVVGITILLFIILAIVLLAKNGPEATVLHDGIQVNYPVKKRGSARFIAKEDIERFVIIIERVGTPNTLY